MGTGGWKPNRYWATVLVFIYLWGGVIFFQTAFADEDTRPLVEREVSRLIEKKAGAVNHKDRQIFLSLIDPTTTSYREEQKRWFNDAIQWVDEGTYQLTLLSLIPEQPHQVRAYIKQEYSHQGKRITTKFPLRYQETEAGWKEKDYPFYHFARGNVVVHYTDPVLEEKAHIALEAAHRGSGILGRRFGWRPKERLEVKLYHQAPLFRQSVKLSLPKWAGGWHEANQAVKLIGDGNVKDSTLFSSGIVHEITHQMVSDLTEDNAAYWLQEGAAEYYQTHLIPGIRRQEAEHPHPRTWKMAQLESIHLERLPKQKATLYYSQCYHFFHFLLETKGIQKMKQLFAVLHMQPILDEDSGEKLAQINGRTRDALKKVYGKSLEELEREWRQVLKKNTAGKTG